MKYSSIPLTALPRQNIRDLGRPTRFPQPMLPSLISPNAPLPHLPSMLSLPSLLPQTLALPPQHAVMKVKRQHHALQVRDRSQDDKHVKDLVRAAPNVKGTRILALGEADLSMLSANFPPLSTWPYQKGVPTAYRNAPQIYSTPCRMIQLSPMRSSRRR